MPKHPDWLAVLSRASRGGVRHTAVTLAGYSRIKSATACASSGPGSQACWRRATQSAASAWPSRTSGGVWCSATRSTPASSGAATQRRRPGHLSAGRWIRSASLQYGPRSRLGTCRPCESPRMSACGKLARPATRRSGKCSSSRHRDTSGDAANPTPRARGDGLIREAIPDRVTFDDRRSPR